MIVVDASAVLEILLARPAGDVVTRRIGDTPTHAPHLIDLEVAQVLRRYEARAEITEARGIQALAMLRGFGIQRYPHEPLLERVWQLRGALTAYDAAYVALAEGLDVPLITTDARLARATGHSASVEVLG